MKAFKNIVQKYNRNIIGLVLIIVAIATASVGLMSSIMNKLDSNFTTFEQPENEFVKQTQAMNGVDKNISFEFESVEKLSSQKLSEYVSVRDIRGNTVNCNFTKISNNKFAVKAPNGGYADGESYVITAKNVSFAQKDIDSSRPFYFSVKHDKVENIILSEKTKQMDSENIIDFDGEFLTVKAQNIAVGDILMFHYATDSIERDVTSKIEEIANQDGEIYTARVGTPDIDEVAMEHQVYGEYVPQIALCDIVGQIDEEELESELMQTPYITAMSEVLAECYPESAKTSNVAKSMNSKSKGFNLPTQTVNKLIPAFEFNVSGGMFRKDDGEMEQSPWQFSFIFTWQVAKAGRAQVSVRATITITKDMKALVSDINGVKNVANISRTTLGFKLDIDGQLDLGIHTDFRRSNPNIMPTNYFSEIIDKDGKITKNEKGINEYQMRKSLERGKKGLRGQAVTNQIKDAQKAIKTRNEKRDVLQKLVNNRVEALNESKPAYRILNIMWPVNATVSISLVLDFIVDIKFTGELGVQHETSWVDESGTIEYKGETTEYHNEDRMVQAGNAYASGELDIKIGLRLQVGVTFLGVVTIGMQIETGVYFYAIGVFSMGWGELNSDAFDENPWSYRLDGGIYFDIKAFAKFDIKIYKKEVAVPVFNYKFDFLNKGEDAVYNLTAKTETLGVMEIESLEATTIVIGENGYVELPKLYISVYNMITGENYDYELQLGDYIIGANDYVYFDGDKTYVIDSSIAEFEDLVYAYYIKDDGTVDANTFIPIYIKKLPVMAESVDVGIDMRGIEVGGSVALHAGFNPQNASYKDVEYFIDYVKVGGVALTGEAAAQRAWISDNGLLTVTKTLAVGDSVGVKARAIVDNIYSSALDIPIIKTPVKEVVLLADGNRADIQPGELLTLYSLVSPTNATNKNVSLAILQGAEYIVIDEGGFSITAKSTAPVKAQIKLIATADGINSAVKTITVGAIPVDSVKVLASGQELSKSATMNIQIGETLQLTATALPANATTNEPQYKITAGAANATVSATGELKIGANATVGSIVKVIANISGVNSPEYGFVVNKVPVESVAISVYQNATGVMQDDRVQLYSSVYPISATYLTIGYEITQGSEYGSISPLGMLSVYGNAQIDAIIKVVAICEGTVSNEIAITVLKRMVQSVGLDAGNISTINEGDSVQLSSHILPVTASNKAVSYNFIEGGDIAYVDESGVLHVSNNVGSPNRVIKVRAVVDDIYSNIIAFTVFVPVRNVDVSLESGQTELQKGEFIRLIATINPTYATNSNVNYEITNNPEYAMLDNAFG
ncbi:MAG: hypothetical protein LBE09_00655, partial [Christensenellaceae bacterium]|nr:hypothetical protein [Christensenellaceae bacterium]